MQSQLIRVRQIKALYQRELTALNRNPHFDRETRNEQAERLWRQACQQIERLRPTAELDFDRFTEDQRRLFDPPPRPAFLDNVE